MKYTHITYLKNKKIILLILSIILLSVFLIIYFNNEKTVLKEDNTKSELFSYMIETSAGSGDYEMATDNKWPGEGYVFNESLSRCENGGTLTWDNKTKSIKLNTDVSDKCYVYFDKQYPFKLLKLTHSSARFEITDDNIRMARHTVLLDNNTYIVYDDNIVEDPFIEDNNLWANTEYIYRLEFMYNDGHFEEYDISIKTQKAPSLSDYCTIGDNFANCIKNNYNNLDKVYYHDEKLLYGAQDYSYRYSGDNPNNYVCFGSDAVICPYDNLYRIIGVFDDQVKLIKADYANSDLLGTNGTFSQESAFPYDATIWRSIYTTEKLSSYYWQNRPIPLSAGSWETSELNIINLNANLLNSFSQNWQEKIAITDWIGQEENSTVFEDYGNSNAKQLYDLENSTLKTDTSKIALMYVSDYLFASEQTRWNYEVKNLGIEDDFIHVEGNNWQKVVELENGNWMYLTPSEATLNNSKNKICETFNDASIFCEILSFEKTYFIRPVFYLNSNITFNGGDGSINNPYRIN